MTEMANDPAIPSSSMILADHLLITGGTFTPTLNDNRQFHVQSDSEDPLKILKKSTAPSAFHDAEARLDPPKCHPRTRIVVLAKIMDWILAQDSETRDALIMWLTGAAGAGKSSIAQSTVENCLKESDALVLACFFFNRSDSTRNHARPLVATLAYQIYRALPAIQSQITTVINDDPLIFTKNLDYQFTTLIMTPLHALYESGQLTQSQSRRLIVIDGLDECINRTSQVSILNMISRAVRTFKLPVIFLIASRPEHDIRETFSSIDMVGILDRIMLDDRYHPDEDIRIFLNDSFRRIKENHPFRRMIPTTWPGHEVIESLVAKSSGQFIYPATVIKFIESIRHRPDDRLEVVLKLRVAGHENPFEQLDMLYRYILSCVDSESIGKVLKMFGYIFNWPKIRTHETKDIRLHHFMPLDNGELSILLCDLGALVQLNNVRSGISSVRVWHASLEDFFSDPERSQEFYIDEQDTLTNIVVRCLQIIPTLSDDLGHLKIIFLLLFHSQANNCKISPELMEEVAKFSIKKNFCQSYSGRRFKFEIREDDVKSVVTFLQLSQRGASHGHKNAHEHSLKQMDEIFASNMEYYTTYGVLTLILCLGVHAGSSPLVPLLSTAALGLSKWYYSIGYIAFEQNKTGEDVLSLTTDQPNMPDAYLQALRDFMQDPTRSGRYCIGPEAYQRATLFCMQMLAYYKRHNIRDSAYVDRDGIPNGPRGNALRDSNCNQCSRIDRTESGQWKVKCEHWVFWEIEKIHLLVGYVIYFLPLCGRSKALIQRCQHPEFFLDVVKQICPDRHELAYQRSQEYLRRMQLPLRPRMWNWFTRIWRDEPLEPETGDEYIY